MRINFDIYLHFNRASCLENVKMYPNVMALKMILLLFKLFVALKIAVAIVLKINHTSCVSVREIYNSYIYIAIECLADSF